MERSKRILDNVHGYIEIPEAICDHIIDTPFFQRLRRIEQTSCRVIFPSARHDRFIHSLGVYHIGKKISKSLEKKFNGNLPDTFSSITKNYIIACLLHDISHTPFSHTFEEFYQNKFNDLTLLLNQRVNTESFQQDWIDREWNSAPHEIMSAIMAISCFPNYVKQPEYDLELIARMIVGCRYSNQDKSLENCFIELLHSNVLDADGLDYVCRDVAMAGYSTNNIDVERLIEEIFIVRDINNNNSYTVCFSNKAIQEIESVLGVKHFQQYNVFAHHIVSYEQELLKESVTSAACRHINGETSYNPKKRKIAIESLCNINSFYEPFEFGIYKIPLLYPSDDDFISLMKYFPNDYYIKQWLTRNYELQPLWKSKTEFKHIFQGVLGDTSRTGIDLWVLSNKCKKFLSKKFNIQEHDIWILEPKIKDRFGITSEIKIFIHGKIKEYKELYPNGRLYFNDIGEQFKYIYIPKSIDKKLVIDKLKEKQRRTTKNDEMQRKKNN